MGNQPRTVCVSATLVLMGACAQNHTPSPDPPEYVPPAPWTEADFDTSSLRRVKTGRWHDGGGFDESEYGPRLKSGTIMVAQPESGKPIPVFVTPWAGGEFVKAQRARDLVGMSELVGDRRVLLFDSSPRFRVLGFEEWRADGFVYWLYEVRIETGEHAGQRAFVSRGMRFVPAEP